MVFCQQRLNFTGELFMLVPAFYQALPELAAAHLTENLVDRAYAHLDTGVTLSQQPYRILFYHRRSRSLMVKIHLVCGAGAFLCASEIVFLLHKFQLG